MVSDRSCAAPGAPILPLLLAGIALAGGCSPPQVEAEQRELLLALATATSAMNNDWLETAAAQVQSQRKAGRLAPATDRAFAAIIEAARSGDWETARSRAYALRDAQRPTQEDLDRLSRREMPAPKAPPGGRP